MRKLILLAILCSPAVVTATTPNNVMLGCPVLPNDAVFNVPINALPADTNSATKIGNASAVAFIFEPSWGISYADASTPTVNWKTFYGQNVFTGVPYPDEYHIRRESGAKVGIFGFAAKGNSSPDHHILTVRKNDCNFFESYNDYLQGFTQTCSDGITTGCNVTSAITYPSTSYAFSLGQGTDAAGLPLAPLTIHVDELESGVINHAARITTGTGSFTFNHFIWPAASTAGGNSGCTTTTCLQLGDRIRLKASFNIAGACNSGITAQDAMCTTLLTQWKNYGFILADTGTNNGITVADDFSTNQTALAALTWIFNKQIPFTSTNVEVVNESSLERSTTSYQVCAFNTTCLSGLQNFVTPAAAFTGSGIGLGIPYDFSVQAGAYSVQIPYWINTGTVSWVKTSGVGSITTGGLYTPPANTTGGSTAVLTGTSSANSSVTAVINVTILPNAGTPAGLRVDTGSLTATTDGNNNTWAADPGILGVTLLDGVQADSTAWIVKPFAAATRQIYQSASFSQADLSFTTALPNGSYTVQILLGTIYDGNVPRTPVSWIGNNNWDINTWDPIQVDVNGSSVDAQFSYGSYINYTFATPVSLYVPAVVTNNILQIKTFLLAPDVGTNLAPALGGKYSTINGIEIVPATPTPSSTQNFFQTGTSSLFTVGFFRWLAPTPVLGDSQFINLRLNNTAGWLQANLGANVDTLEAAEGRVTKIGYNGATTSSLVVSFVAPNAGVCWLDPTPTGSGFTRTADSGGARVRNITLTGLAAHTAISGKIICSGSDESQVPFIARTN